MKKYIDKNVILMSQITVEKDITKALVLKKNKVAPMYTIYSSFFSCRWISVHVFQTQLSEFNLLDPLLNMLICFT